MTLEIDLNGQYEEEDLRILRATERRIAAVSSVTATPASYARRILGIKEDVAGLTIVDLASGASSLVAGLRNHGAKAIGIDALYEDTATLKRSAKSEVNKKLMNLAVLGLEIQYAEIKKSWEMFLDSYRDHLEFYKPGWLTNTGLPENFSDMTLSLDGLSNLGGNLRLMYLAVNEAIRITKPGKEVIIAPFDFADSYSNHYPLHHFAVAEKLKLDGHTVEREQVETGMFRLRVTKKA